jgi:hypothetical protein
VEDRPSRRRLRRLASLTAASALVTGGVITAAVGSSGEPEPAHTAAAATTPTRMVTVAPAKSSYRADRSAAISRSAKRVTLREKPKVTDREFMIAPLNLWPAPKEKGKPLAVLHKGGKVAITGVRRSGFAQILYTGQVRWVNADYLADAMPKPKPQPEPQPARQHERTTTTSASGSSQSSGSSGAAGVSAGLSSAPCPDGSGTESGLTSSAVRLFRAACNAFPALTSYGGYDNHGEHSSGKAIDFMTTSSSLGGALADWARAHASALDIYDVIWAQHIWTPQRSSEGWRSMSDRGSATANHYDHVHIAVN